MTVMRLPDYNRSVLCADYPSVVYLSPRLPPLLRSGPVDDALAERVAEILGIGRNEIVDLQWAEPWNGVTADLDGFLISGGEMVAKKEENNVSTTKRPVEWFRWKNTKSTPQEVQLVINRCTGA